MALQLPSTSYKMHLILNLLFRLMGELKRYIMHLSNRRNQSFATVHWQFFFSSSRLPNFLNIQKQSQKIAATTALKAHLI